jgi:hypothetical protein
MTNVPVKSPVTDRSPWESVLRVVLNNNNVNPVYAQYTVTVRFSESGPPQNDYNYGPQHMEERQMLMAYNGLDGITAKQIFDDFTNMFTNFYTFEIVDALGCGVLFYGSGPTADW